MTTSQLCSSCDTELTEDISIFIWNKEDREETICEGCNSTMETELRAKGWTEDGDND